MISADRMIAKLDSLPSRIQSLLQEFRTKIILEDVAFFDSADFYGGDFYDVLNHFRQDDGIRNFSDPSYSFSLENLRVRAVQAEKKISPELVRLLAAYANASDSRISFQTFFDAAIGSGR